MGEDLPNPWNVAAYEGTTQFVCEALDSSSDTKRDRSATKKKKENVAHFAAQLAANQCARLSTSLANMSRSHAHRGERERGLREAGMMKVREDYRQARARSIYATVAPRGSKTIHNTRCTIHHRSQTPCNSQSEWGRAKFGQSGHHAHYSAIPHASGPVTM